MTRITMQGAVLAWAALLYSANTIALELSPGDTIAVYWICNDRQSIEKIQLVAMLEGHAAFKAAVRQRASGDRSDRCMIFGSPTMVELVDRQFSFTDSDPDYYVEAWSVKFGAFSGYTFFGQAIGADSGAGQSDL